MKGIIALTFILLLIFYPEINAQRRETDVLRNTDDSRRREEPVQQERKRQEDSDGKVREIPRHDPPKRQPDRYIEQSSSNPVNQNPPSNYDMSPDYLGDSFQIDYSVSADIYIHEPIVIYTSEKEQALELMEDEYFDAAIKKLTISIGKNSKDLELYLLRGIANIGAEFYTEAIEDFDYYLKFFDEDGEGYYRRGVAKFLDHRKEEALQDFNISIAFGCSKAKQLIKKYY